MNILILDDDIYWRDMIYNKISYYALQTEHEYHFFKCQNQAEALNILKNNDINVIISDIAIDDDTNNIKFIRNAVNEYHVIVIYVTNYDRYALQSFGLNVYKYILKKDFINESKEIVDFIEYHFFNSSKMIFDTQIGKISLQNGQILYFECYGHDIFLCTSQNKYKLKNITLKEIEISLPDIFILINRNTIVNLTKVKILDKEMMILENDKTLYISRRRKKQVYEEYCKHLRIGI